MIAEDLEGILQTAKPAKTAQASSHNHNKNLAKSQGKIWAENKGFAGQKGSRW